MRVLAEAPWRTTYLALLLALAGCGTAPLSAFEKRLELREPCTTDLAVRIDGSGELRMALAKAPTADQPPAIQLVRVGPTAREQASLSVDSALMPITVDEGGVVAMDRLAERVSRIGPTGEVVWQVRPFRGRALNLAAPAVAVSPGGFIAIARTEENPPLRHLALVTPSGEVSHSFGRFGTDAWLVAVNDQGFSALGTGSRAQAYDPSGRVVAEWQAAESTHLLALALAASTPDLLVVGEFRHRFELSGMQRIHAPGSHLFVAYLVGGQTAAWQRTFAITGAPLLRASAQVLPSGVVIAVRLQDGQMKVGDSPRTRDLVLWLDSDGELTHHFTLERSGVTQIAVGSTEQDIAVLGKQVSERLIPRHCERWLERWSNSARAHPTQTRALDAK